jgi:hypothetical protein
MWARGLNLTSDRKVLTLRFCFPCLVQRFPFFLYFTGARIVIASQGCGRTISPTTDFSSSITADHIPSMVAFFLRCSYLFSGLDWTGGLENEENWRYTHD